MVNIPVIDDFTVPMSNILKKEERKRTKYLDLGQAEDFRGSVTVSTTPKKIQETIFFKNYVHKRA